MTVREWFQKYTQREQVYLLAVAATVALYLLLVVIWQPIAGMRNEMAARNILVAEQLARVKAMAGELQALKSSGAGQRSLNMNQLINSSTNQYGIQPSRIQPNSRGETQLRFEAVEFSKLLQWLHGIEATEGVVIREVAINQGDKGGIVKATIRLGQGA
jgi:type II secretory pathway component PulM